MKRHELLADADRLEGAIKDTQGIYENLEGARKQLSRVEDELRGQTTIIKERVTWLIKELDNLRDLILKITQPGDSA